MADVILVPTDLSLNSKGGIRFALQLATQTKSSLVFYYCMLSLKPTRWSDVRYEAYVAQETETANKALTTFVSGIYQGAGIKNPRFQCVVEQKQDVQRAILKYASRINAKAICMSTRGGGRFKKLIGTHASGIITRSSIPVYIVPKNYRRSRIEKILYASDLNQIGSELKLVRKVSKKLNAKVRVYHYDYLADLDEAKKKLDKIARRYRYPDVKFVFQKYDIEKSLAQHLIKDMTASKASLAVLFTDQKRGWFDKLFLSSKSVDVALASKIPLLTIPKA